jgi:hypothetical protein
MLTFLEETLQTIKRNHSNISELVLILPSKRACGFLLNYLRKSPEKTAFAPTIISIEEFIETLSDLKIISTTEMLFKSYEAYLQTHSISDKDDFEIYSSWAITLLGDFNEIDRYLVDPNAFFNYLGSIKALEKWSMKDQDKTNLIESYLQFWNQLPQFYETLKELLLTEGEGYQGLVYRKASEDIEHYIQLRGDDKHLFIGFNALNNAEQHIFQELLETGNTEIYWDTDSYFYEDKKHSASLFFRSYTENWPFYRKNSELSLSSHYETFKTIKFVEVQKNIGQAKYLGTLLSQYSEEQLNNTAVVLSDEQLLLPVLSSLPQNINSVNITMGVALKAFPASIFFETLLHLHLKPSNSLYYQDILAILNHPTAALILKDPQGTTSKIIARNSSYLSLELLELLAGEDNKEAIQLLFGDWKNDSLIALKSVIKLLLKAKDRPLQNSIDLIVLFKLYSIFKQIDDLNNRFSHLKTIKTIHRLYLELIATTTLDFEGDAYSGLQIMGVLETRVLDFENVIMLSVNEGIIPAGKSNASFITYDLKQQFGLPSYFEKDAIYTYHFYRLLHRAKHVTLLYNSHAEGLNSGEKSRFLLQLEIEGHRNHTIEKVIVNPKVAAMVKKTKTIVKTNAVIKRLREIAEKGFSPSALTNYIRNPLDFYYQKILKINEFQEVEETVAYNTLGTIVHDTLQEFYEPLKGAYLTIELLQKLKLQIDNEVSLQFKKTFKEGDFTKGINLIIFEVAKRYISNFLDFEIAEIKAGNKIKILRIESDLKIEIPIDEIDFPVYIGGKVDRVDEYNGLLRIIDYKTGLVQQGELELIDWGPITQDYKYNKAFQVLSYAFMIKETETITQAEAGIVSFKNLNSGFLKFGTKDKIGGRTKDQLITQDTLSLFVTELKKLIVEICDQEIPFTEKVIE